MALINCPECGKQISDKAEKCPECSYPLNATTAVKAESKEGCFLQTLNAGCIITAVVIGLIILFGILGS